MKKWLTTLFLPLLLLFANPSFADVTIEGFQRTKADILQFKEIPAPAVSGPTAARLYKDADGNLKLSLEGAAYVNIGTAGALGTDVVTTVELDDGADSPVAGECLKVATGGLEIEYSSCSTATVNTADIADVSVTQTEFAELETIGTTTISAAQWTGLGGATTAGIALWDDANAAAQLVTLGLTATVSEINTPLDGASVTLTEFQELETIGATVISAADWTAVAALVGVNTGDQTINTADIGDVSVTQTELAELEAIGTTVISAADWTAVAALVGVNTGDNTVATTGDSATAFFASGEIEDARVVDTITATNYLLLAGGALTGELTVDELGIEFQETDGITDCSSFASTGGGIFYDDSEGVLKKCQDNVLTVLDTTGGTPATADISDVSVTQTEFAELETIGAVTISAAQWAGLGGATTAGIALWDDAAASNQLVTLGLTATASEINTPLDGASVTLTEFQELETIGATVISASDWTAVAALVGVNTGDNTVATSGDSATSFFSSGEIADAQIVDTITATNYLLLAGGTLSGELVVDQLGIEFQETDTITDCSSFSTTGGGIFYDDSEGVLKKCQDNTLTVLDTGGAEVNDLEADDPPNVADTEVYIGTGAGTGAWSVFSGDATLANDGTLSFASDSVDEAHMSTGYLWLPVQSAKLLGGCVTNADATQGAQIVGSEDSWALLFDDDVDEGACWDFVMPETYNAGAIDVRLIYSMASANTSDEVTWEAAFCRHIDGDDLDTIACGALNSVLVTVPDGAGVVDTAVIAFTNSADADSVVKGAFAQLQISTDANGGAGVDDAVDDRELRGVLLEW